MAQQIMYAGKANSPATTLSGSIDAVATSITLANASVLPPAPNICTIGIEEDAETVSYAGISTNTLTGVTRGIQGTAKAWPIGTPVARMFTEKDYATIIANIQDLVSSKLAANASAVSASKLVTARSINLGTAVTSTATNFDGSANITIPVNGVSEAYLTWGGRNLSGGYAPIDAAMVPVLGANRLAFTAPSAITIEYSRDNGATWIDYGASDATKLNLLCGLSGTIQVGGGGYAAGTDYTNYQVRVTINTSGQIYTVLNKFVIYVSTNGSSGSWCTIDARLQSNYTGNIDTWATFANKVPVSGWSGYNVINTSGLITYGNVTTSQYGQVRFTFGQTGYSTTYTGLHVYKILGFGGVGWTTPSTLAGTGLIYTYDYNKNVTFPANLKGKTLESYVATGTAPIIVASTTKVTNLNTDMLDDQEGSYYLDRSKHTGTQLANTISDFASSVLSTLLAGLSTTTNAVITAADSILTALGKLQKQITDHKNDSSNPHSVTKAQIGLGNVDNIKIYKSDQAPTASVGNDGDIYIKYIP